MHVQDHIFDGRETALWQQFEGMVQPQLANRPPRERQGCRNRHGAEL